MIFDFNEFFVFRVAYQEYNEKTKTWDDLLGLLILHTWDLVVKRKIAQGVEGLYEKRFKEFELLQLDNILKTKLPPLWNYDEKLDLDYQIINFYNELKKPSYPSLPENSEYDKIYLAQLNKKRINFNLDILFSKIGSEKKKTKEEIIEASQLFIDTTKDQNTKAVVEDLLMNLTELFALENEYEDKEIPNDYFSIIGFSEQFEYAFNYIDLQRKNYNAKQNGLKVSANSTFGFTGAGEKEFDKNGFLHHSGKHQVLPISACITFMGRYCIDICKQFLENEGFEIIYVDTDSLFVDSHLPNTREGLEQSFVMAKKYSEILSKMFQRNNAN